MNNALHPSRIASGTKLSFNLARREERFWILEFLPEEIRGNLFGLDRDRMLHLRDSWQLPRGAALPKRLILTKRWPVIVLLHPSLAWTVLQPLLLKKTTAEPVSDRELED